MDKSVAQRPNIIQLFETANSHLRWPVLKVPSASVPETILSFRPAMQPSNTAIWVSNGKRKGDPESIVFGRITHAPSFQPMKKNCTPLLVKEIVDICKDPTFYAALRGQQVSWCCFCGLELTNKHSLAVGYGPICAGNWGLPWGEEPTEEEKL